MGEEGEGDDLKKVPVQQQLTRKSQVRATLPRPPPPTPTPPSTLLSLQGAAGQGVSPLEGSQPWAEAIPPGPSDREPLWFLPPQGAPESARLSWLPPPST